VLPHRQEPAEKDKKALIIAKTKQAPARIRTKKGCPQPGAASLHGFSKKING
jgi:hypothetical protein